MEIWSRMYGAAPRSPPPTPSKAVATLPIASRSSASAHDFNATNSVAVTQHGADEWAALASGAMVEGVDAAGFGSIFVDLVPSRCAAVRSHHNTARPCFEPQAS